MRIIYNSPTKKTLSKKQQRYVRLYGKRMTVREMVARLKVPKTRIYSFLYNENLPFIKTQPTRRGGDKRVEENYFNPLAHENWIV
jgi:hypothetical protein